MTAVFTLVGVTGEDDLDAPDLLVEPSPAIQVELGREGLNGRKPLDGLLRTPRPSKAVPAPEHIVSSLRRLRLAQCRL